MPAKAKRGRSSLIANQTTSFWRVSGFGSGAYSEKLFAGTRHPAPPVRRRRVADVGDRRSAKFRRRRHSPAHHGQLTLGAGFAYHGRGIIVKYAGHWRQVADVAVQHAKSGLDAEDARPLALSISNCRDKVPQLATLQPVMEAIDLVTKR